ncbi:hypothetical protein ACFL6I_29290, partial [candidate division KSB1 bacterium]
MTKSFYLQLIFILSSVILHAQIGITYEKTYGLPGYNYGITSHQTADSGYIILGNKSGSIGSNDIYLIRVDQLGTIIWDKAFGGTHVEWGDEMIITSDNHYLIAGYTNQNNNNGYDILLLKVDTTGNLKWIKTYGGPDWDLGFSVIESADSNYYIVGETFSFGPGGGDAYIIKTNADGDTIWTRAYGGIQEDAGFSIIQVQNNHFLISGFTKSYGSGKKDCFVIKIDHNGDTIFTNSYGYSGDEIAYDVVLSKDNNYIFGGFSEDSISSINDGYIFKTDTNGTKMWEIFGGFSDNAIIFDVLRGRNNDLFFLGNTTSYGLGSNEIFVIKLDINGFAGGNTFGSPDSDEGSSINMTFDKGYIITGSTEGKGPNVSDIYFIKIDSLLSNDTNSVHFTKILEFNNLSTGFHIFPNPVINELWIDLAYPLTGRIIINIYNYL